MSFIAQSGMSSISMLRVTGTILAAVVYSCVCCVLCMYSETVFAWKAVYKHCECYSVSLGSPCQQDPHQCIVRHPALTLRTVGKIMYPWTLICPQMNQYVTHNYPMIIRRCMIPFFLYFLTVSTGDAP